ncbi:penicillin acylase family protein [Noviherbaspirillum galbum]|uniref:Penicillin acylase family protein n=1 Tax=Noviherbaspirillum galbum TaxID=2709383 RepID=A0A6B3SK43_9BURK|nr:penicillin acylase family protein [Noviherbaspirillum galbum]NEX59725.1 penicillin acylase family protein [Noviherbaspirillum galbum]
MTRLFRRFALAFALILIVLAGTIAWYACASQPSHAGKTRLPGLRQQVEVLRDAEGIPHIYAAAIEDAYFALGYSHAQDRLWQMEINRRIAAGRMAEILGPNALDIDRFLRTLGVRHNAEAIAARLPGDTRAVLDAYARGVNAFLDNRTGPLPPEFLLTGAPAPAHWEAADSIGWQTMMAWDLGGNWTQELLRMRLAQTMSLDEINAFLPPYPGDAVLQTMDYTGLYRGLKGTVAQLEAVAAIAPPSYLPGMGSNNWVVSGAATQSGKPLLANDPHLGLSAPALWYFAHLSAPGLNVIGATLPGVPGVVLGRNDRIAWGFTNTAPDVQDLYIEKIDPSNPGRYQTPDGWADFQVRTEIIKVKGQPDVSLPVRETRHGPVISGAIAVADKLALDARSHVVSFAWTALRPDDLTVQAGIKLNRAGNWEQFLAAARDFTAPQQNMVYADVDGNIGFIAPARIPLRKPENDLHGLAPAPGWDARYDWNGFLPFEELPRQFNPASHRVVTANQKIVGPDYPHFLTSEWSPSYRADRIGQLLDGLPRHTVESFMRIQQDVVSLAAQEILPVLKRTQASSDRGRQAMSLISAWDGTMAADRPEPLIYNAWMRMASRRMFEDRLGDALMKDYWEQRNVHAPMVAALTGKMPQAGWCVPRGEAPSPGACGALLSASLESALDDLSRRYGSDMGAWKWGKAHEARSEHRPFSKVGALAPLFDIRVPSPGDTYTVNVGRFSLRDEKEPFVNRHAASLRAIYDLADLERSVFMHSTGQSGNVFSPLYRDLAQRWVEVKYLPMQMRRENVEKGVAERLVLAP